MRYDNKQNKAKCDVLVTCGRFAHQIVADLYRSGLDVWVTDSGDVPLMHSIFVRGALITRSYESDEELYITDLVNFTRENNVGVLIPLFDALIISKHRARFPQNTIIACEDYEKLQLLSNKRLLLEHARSIGIPMPRMYSDDEKITSFPVVYKLVHGRSGEGVYIIHSDSELEDIKTKFKGLEHIITEYIAGRDYSIDCIHSSDFYASSCYRSFMDSNESAVFMSPCREVIQNEMMQKYAEWILDSLNYTGICGFDFMVDEKSGAVFLLEANPRYTGGAGVQIACGFRIPSLHYGLVTNKKIEAPVITYGIKKKSLTKCIGLAYQRIRGNEPDYKIRYDLHLPLSQYEDFLPGDLLTVARQILRNKRRLVTIFFYALFRIRVKI